MPFRWNKDQEKVAALSEAISYLKVLRVACLAVHGICMLIHAGKVLQNDYDSKFVFIRTLSLFEILLTAKQ